MNLEGLKNSRILVIEDEPELQNIVADLLKTEGFSVLARANGKSGIRAAQDKQPDLIILDLCLPDMSGNEVCRVLKHLTQTRNIPIVILSAKSDHSEKATILDMGAEDYVTKPFNSFELVARIRVALRRPKRMDISDSEAKQHGPVSIDLEARSVTLGQTELALTRKEFNLLVFLINKEGKTLSRQALLNALWDKNFDSMEGTIDTHIKTLRQKLGTASLHIETVPGLGYRWTAST